MSILNVFVRKGSFTGDKEWGVSHPTIVKGLLDLRPLLKATFEMYLQVN
jgi:hypothetical protein